MSYWLKSISRLSLALAVLVASTLPATAHPHAYIDMRTTLIFDRQSQVSGLRVHWIFDEFYTLFTLEVIDPDGDGKAAPDLIRSLAEQNLKNLAEYSYFTFITVDGVQPDYGAVVDYDSYLQGERLVMEFTVPLTRPANPLAHELSYAVYDPTYYIEVFHVETNRIAMEGPAPDGCLLDLREPNPDQDTVSLAASLDQNETAGDGLGALFAEQVHLRCQ